MVQSPKRQQVAGETQSEDEAINTGQSKYVRVQGEVAGIVGHVSEGKTRHMGNLR